MAKTVSAYVPQQAGEGDAYISKPIDTSKVYDFGLREQARVDKEAAAKAQALKDQQDMYVESMMDVPDKINEDFKTPLTQEAMGIAKDKMSLISSGTANYQNTKEINERISNLAIKSAQADKQINHFKLAKEEVKGMTDPWYLSTEAGSDLNSVYAISTNEGLHNHMDQGVDEIREEMHGGKYYNSRGAGQSWAEEMEEFVNADFKTYSKEQNAKGFKDVSETYSGLTKFKPNGKMDVDEEGRPKVDYDKLKDYLPDWLKYAENENWVRKEQAKYEEGEAPTAEDLFIQQVAPFFSVSYDKKLSGNVKTDDSGEGNEETEYDDMMLRTEAFVNSTYSSEPKTLTELATMGTGAGADYREQNPDVSEKDLTTLNSKFITDLVSAYEKGGTAVIIDRDKSYVQEGVFYPIAKPKGNSRVKLDPVDLNTESPVQTLSNRIYNLKTTTGKRKNVESGTYNRQLSNNPVVSTREVNKSFSNTPTEKAEDMENWVANNLPEGSKVVRRNNWNDSFGKVPPVSIKFTDGDTQYEYKFLGDDASEDDVAKNNKIKARMFRVSAKGSKGSTTLSKDRKAELDKIANAKG